MLVYKITNKVNQKCYIGSTVNFGSRINKHLICSTKNIYPSYNYPLQKAFRKYGIENFTFEILENNIDKNEIAKKEHDYIIKFNSLTNVGWGYNQTTYTECAIRDPKFIRKMIERTGRVCAEIDENENIVEIFESLHDAARKRDLVGHESSIKQVCEGKMRKINGMIFRYILNNEIVEPVFLTRERYKQICGISIFDKNDIVYYQSISEAARKENIIRSSISKCIAGEERYTQVGKRIWRMYQNGQIIDNDIDIDSIIFKYSTYCIVDYKNNKTYTGTTIKELAESTGLSWGTVQANLKKNKRIGNYGYYRLDKDGKPITEEV